jgi:tetratricopeptide (TPR) repeat protein
MPRGSTAKRLLLRLVCVMLLASTLAPAPTLAQGAPAAPPGARGQGDPARAQQLDQLFASLKVTTTQEEGDAIVAQIWTLWQQSGDPELDAAMQQAVLLMGQGLGGLALPILDDIVGRAPQWAEGWNKRATLLYLMGEHDRSLADIDRVLALEPRHFGALAGIGLIRIQKDQKREALAAFRRALAVNPFLRERYGIIPALEKELGEKPI